MSRRNVRVEIIIIGIPEGFIDRGSVEPVELVD